jgi:sigma-B regulation protein RsbU (phosphoserine phosphatase)
VSQPQPSSAVNGAAQDVADRRDGAGAFALLADMTHDFARALDLEPALRRALDSIASQLGAEAGSLWLLDRAGKELTCHASVGPVAIDGARIALSQGIVGRCVRDNVCQSVLDAAEDPAFFGDLDRQSGMTTHTLLCAPMSIGGQAIGAVELINRQGGRDCFSESDEQVLQVLAASAALAVTNSQMAAAAVEHQQVQRELSLAAEIQRGLLPGPRPGPFPICGANVPARTVSGDFFDYIDMPDGRIAFCLGDVSGKGIKSALLMAKTASLYRCLAKTIESPGKLLGVLNDELAETASQGMFVTMAAGIVDPETGVVVLANAGHEPPLHHTRSGEFHPVPAEEPPLGIASGIAGPEGFPESSLRIDGGALYIFSDGLTEAISATGEQLGATGLADLIEAQTGDTLQERVDGVMQAVGRLEHRDDLTLLAVCNEERCSSE